MTASGFLSFVENSLRTWLPTIVGFRCRPANNDMTVSLSGVDDFVVLVLAATSAHIPCEIVGSFAKTLGDKSALSNCVLILKLQHNCQDSRLATLLYEVFGRAVVKGPLEAAHGLKEWKEIESWERWLAAQTPKGTE